MRDPEIDTRGYTWIQKDSNLTSLRSLKELSKSVTFELIWTL